MTTEQIIQSLFKNVFEFDTHKIINRAPSYFFDDAFVEEIRKSGLTWKLIKEIADKVPIFVYGTRLTLHGVISEEQITRIKKIRNLESCIRNDNGTLSIKYNAIDLENKEAMDKILDALFNYFGILAPRLVCNSEGTFFHKEFLKKDPMEEMFNKIDTTLFYGEKFTYLEPHKKNKTSKYHMHIGMKLMKPEMMWDIITNWTGITLEMYEKRIEEKANEIDAYHETQKQNRLNLIAEGVLNDKKRQDNYEASLKELAHLPLWDGKVDKDMIIVSSARTDSDLRFQFVWLHKNPWDWRYECHASHDNKESLPGGGIGHFFRFHAPGHRDRFLADRQWYVWEEKAKLMPKVEIPQPKVQELELRLYKKALALFGNTSPHEKLLEKLGGKKNDFLIHPVTGIKTAGWIFFKSQEWILKKTFNIEIAPNIKPAFQTNPPTQYTDQYYSPHLNGPIQSCNCLLERPYLS